MTGRDIFKAISEADDEMIDELEEPVQKKNHALRWGALAACLCLAVGIGAVVMKGEQPPRPTPQPSTATEVLTPPEPAPLPPWEEREIWKRFPSMEGYTCYGGTMAEEQVGELLETVTLTGRDELTGAEHTIQAEVYSAADFPKETVVAVRYEGDSEYYAFTGGNYHPATLGQLLEELSLKETAEWKDVAYSTNRAGVELWALSFVNVPSDALWEQILSETQAPNVGEEAGSRKYELGVDFRLTIPVTGNRYFDLKVTKDGYLTTNILDSENVFYIGEEKTRAFVKDLENHFRSKEKAPDDTGYTYRPDGASTPAYHPTAQAVPTATPTP